MKFGLLYEIALPRQVAATGKTESDAYWEAIEQIQYGTLTHEESMASLRTFAEKVMPRFA